MVQGEGESPEHARVAIAVRVLRGEPAAVVAAELGIAEAVVTGWCDRFMRAGTAAVLDRFAHRRVDFEALFDASPDYLFAKDRAYRYLYVNRAYAEFLGMSPAAIIGLRDTDLVQPQADGDPAVASFRALDNQVLAGTLVRSARVTVVRNGAAHQVDVLKLPIRDDGNDVIGVLTHARDVTEAVRAEEALRASEARYRRLLELAPVAMYVHDGARVVFANRAFAELMGAAAPAALVGYPVLEIAHPDERGVLLERVRAIAGGLVGTPSMEFRALRLDGLVRHVRVMGTQCVYEGSPAIQVVMVDETEQRRARAEREALETQLLHAQRLEALGTLAGGIAHDFNNLLAVIGTNAELARADLPAGHPVHESLDDVVTASAGAKELVRGILAFGRNQPLERKLLRLVDQVQEAARLLRSTLPAAIALIVEADDFDSSVVADPTQIQQVLMNLGTNAWHAIGRDRLGHIRIGVTPVILVDGGPPIHPDLGTGRYVCVSVRDDGDGMDAATAQRAFDPFFTTKPVGEGTGLGLSVAHGIVKGHGGAITLSSTPGLGTEFRLYFPASVPAAASRATIGSQPEPTLAGLRVMLVDDDAAVRSVARRLLQRMGLQVSEHPAIDAALSALRAEPDGFDLVVTDHNMRGGSGIELAREVQQLRPGLPIVLTSGYLDEVVLAEAESLGVRVRLAKPFTAAELSAAVVTALGTG